MSIDNLTAIGDCLQKNEPLPEELKSWLTDAIEKWELGESIHDALSVYDTARELRLWAFMLQDHV